LSSRCAYTLNVNVANPKYLLGKIEDVTVFSNRVIWVYNGGAHEALLG
jgi:hypothetical protein